MRNSNPPSKFSQEALSPAGPARPRAAAPEMRATLDGLEVQPGQFDAWLDAGGERRRKPRASGPQNPKR